MITVTNFRNINHAAYDEIWSIVRSLKNPGKMKHVPERNGIFGCLCGFQMTD